MTLKKNIITNKASSKNIITNKAPSKNILTNKASSKNIITKTSSKNIITNKVPSKNILNNKTPSNKINYTTALLYEIPYFYNNFQGSYYRFEASIYNYAEDNLLKKYALT